jgi:L-iditol 2-dehydrogenase
MIITWRETLSYLTRMGVRSGMQVLIIGSGGTVLSCAAHCKHVGAEVTLIGSTLRKQAVDRLSVRCFIDYKSDYAESLRSVAPDGFDAIIDSVGKRDSLNAVLPHIRKGGTVGIYGIDELKSVSVNPTNAPGSFTFYSGGYAEVETHHAVTSLMLEGKLDAGVFYDVGNPIPLERLGTAFDDLKERKAVKYLIEL